jgi:glutamate N-acetyltransferase/amino-acid N-acetyltransferase
VAAGLQAGGGRDVALVINDGPGDAAAAVFTTGAVKANPVLWSERTIADGRLRAVVLNSGGANHETGAEGFQLTHATAEQVAELAGISAFDVLVGSTGRTGGFGGTGGTEGTEPLEPLPDRERLLAGIIAAHAELREDGGDDAAHALGPAATPARQSSHTAPSGWTIGGLAEAGGSLTVITTDADADPDALDAVLHSIVQKPSSRMDRDNGSAANFTVALLASAASGVRPDPAEFAEAVRRICRDLGHPSPGPDRVPDPENSACVS